MPRAIALSVRFGLMSDPETCLNDWQGWGLGLGGRPRVLAAVPGGRTNRNFRLEAPGLDLNLLLRINHPEPARLGIDRDREQLILARVAQAGFGRPCLYRAPSDRYALFKFIEARAWTAADFASADQRARLWPLIERLAELDLPGRRRRYLAYVRAYWQRLVAASLVDRALERRWHAFEPELEAFDRADWPPALVHHDLIPANVLDTGQRLVLIDWEYAELGHSEIDVWSLDPRRVREPFIAELMGWINALWERLVRADWPR
jgi:thiamine kinase